MCVCDGGRKWQLADDDGPIFFGVYMFVQVEVVFYIHTSTTTFAGQIAG